jgi:hypothetical protein
MRSFVCSLFVSLSIGVVMPSATANVAPQPSDTSGLEAFEYLRAVGVSNPPPPEHLEAGAQYLDAFWFGAWGERYHFGQSFMWRLNPGADPHADLLTEGQSGQIGVFTETWAPELLSDPAPTSVGMQLADTAAVHTFWLTRGILETERGAVEFIGIDVRLEVGPNLVLSIVTPYPRAPIAHAAHKPKRDLLAREVRLSDAWLAESGRAADGGVLECLQCKIGCTETAIADLQIALNEHAACMNSCVMTAAGAAAGGGLLVGAGIGGLILIGVLATPFTGGASLIAVGAVVGGGGIAGGAALALCQNNCDLALANKEIQIDLAHTQCEAGCETMFGPCG